MQRSWIGNRLNDDWLSIFHFHRSEFITPRKGLFAFHESIGICVSNCYAKWRQAARLRVGELHEYRMTDWCAPLQNENESIAPDENEIYVIGCHDSIKHDKYYKSLGRAASSSVDWSSNKYRFLHIKLGVIAPVLLELIQNRNVYTCFSY